MRKVLHEWVYLRPLGIVWLWAGFCEAGLLVLVVFLLQVICPPFVSLSHRFGSTAGFQQDLYESPLTLVPICLTLFLMSIQYSVFILY